MGRKIEKEVVDGFKAYEIQFSLTIHKGTYIGNLTNFGRTPWQLKNLSY